MSGGPFDPGFDGLPESLPIFPLPGALLLPGGRLPLNIFEPRYLSMIEDALGEARMIGMVQPLAPEPDPVSAEARLYETGCAGRIVSFAETEDG
ncbi:MAG: LON peptidase substrate-binding domain-containing protein, partial [Rhodospirillales bacterium]|nr:LON peptidase substrate-binding domain-containing protein [Rhodospirillales bacterium]